MVERSNADLRRHRRLTLRILVDYFTDSGVRCDYATTLGAGGMFLECEPPLETGTRVKARFKLPGGDDYHEVEGYVVWRSGAPVPGRPSQPPGVGLKFTDQSAIARLARELERYQC